MQVGMNNEAGSYYLAKTILKIFYLLIQMNMNT